MESNNLVDLGLGNIKKSLIKQEKNEKEDNIPIFITLIGNTSVGKSYYLFSLGLALSKYPSLREYWAVTGISDGYKEQIKIWKQEHQLEHQIGATNLGKNIQLSFTIKNKKTLRQYQIIMADMAGEEIIGYLNNESIYTRIANDIKMRIRLSSGILLMADSENLYEDREINAWEELLTTGIFSTLDICLMKADRLPSVQNLLNPIPQENVIDNVFLKTLRFNLLDDKTLQQDAHNAFSHPKLTKLQNYMKNHAIQVRYHYISSTGLSSDGQLSKIKEPLDEFTNYNIFQPIFDILDNLENGFEKGFTGIFKEYFKSFYWKSTLASAQKIYMKKRYREAIEILFDKQLIKDSHQYPRILKKLNHILKNIHSHWLEEQESSQEFSHNIDIENLEKKIQYFYREVIDRDELDVEISKYKQNLTKYIEQQWSVEVLDNSSVIKFFHSQLKKIRCVDDHGESNIKDVLLKLQDIFSVLIENKIRSLKSLQEPSSKNTNALITNIQIISLYISIWFTDEASWLKVIKTEFGEMAEVEARIKNVLQHIVRISNNEIKYSVGLRGIRLMQKNSENMGDLLHIPKKMFVKKYKELAKLRLNFFSKIPPISYMNKTDVKTWLNDKTFSILKREWDFWQQDLEFSPSENLLQIFPDILAKCPVCLGEQEIIESCKCICGNWFMRFFSFFIPQCTHCSNNGKLIVTCNLCQGSGLRKLSKKGNQ